MASITLTDGLTEYELAGAESGTVVVLLHGGSVPMWTWDLQVPVLSQAGFRILRYDMYGKGKSACPPAVHDRALFQRQLLELLAALRIDGAVHLVGFSFGGATAASFTAAHPDKVRSLALISPLLHYSEGNALLRVVRAPVVGGLVLRHVVLRKSLDRASKLWAGTEAAARYSDLFLQQAGRPDFEKAFLSFLRSDALDDYAVAYERLGETSHKPLLVWGTLDEDIPAAHIARMRKLLPAAIYHELAGIRHGTVFQSSDMVNRLLVDHLKKSAAGDIGRSAQPMADDSNPPAGISAPGQKRPDAGAARPTGTRRQCPE